MRTFVPTRTARAFLYVPVEIEVFEVVHPDVCYADIVLLNGVGVQLVRRPRSEDVSDP